MGDLIDGDDGMPVEDVRVWAKEKHEYLTRYLNISRGVRGKWLGEKKGGATYIDLFCGPGRAIVRDTNEAIDGSCVAAWKMSVAGKAPFSQVHIADLDPQRLELAKKRLLALGAPVVAHQGEARDTVKIIRKTISPHAFNFAFIDPFNIGALNFSIISELSKLKYIDMLIHVSKMDLQRNLGVNIKEEQSAFDMFAPGWRDAVPLNQPEPTIRRLVFEYWKGLVEKAGAATSGAVDTRLITGTRGQHLYWLLLAAKHELAHKFWRAAADDKQGDLFG